MKHSINSKQPLDAHLYLVSVDLVPESDTEKKAIQNTEAMISTDEEREIVSNYLHFGLGITGYSIVELVKQRGNTFFLKIFI